MPAIPKHTTAVAEGKWRAEENVARIRDSAGGLILRKEFAWVDPAGNPDTKAAYKFPHHFVSPDGTPGAASLSACRNALGRLPNAEVPDLDRSDVMGHIQHHLDAAKSFDDALRSMGGLVTKGDALHVKGIRAEAREVDFVASTDAVDAHREIIDQGSWQLSQYRSNPVVLYGHNSRDLPIGKATRVEVQDGQLVCTIQFASAEANPEAEKVFRLVQEKVLRAVSVGFIPTDGKYEMKDQEEVWVWYSPVLKEISVVPVPANYEALAKMKAAFGDAAQREVPGAAVPAPRETNNEEAGTAGEERTGISMKTAEQLAKELEEKTAAHNEATKKLAEFELRAEKAETRAGAAEKGLAETSAKVAALESAARTLETEHAKACTDRDAAVKRADEADGKLVELEVDSVVGKKIAPAEKEEFLELRKSNPALFRKMVERRPDMKLEERVTENDDKVAAKAPSKEDLSGKAGATPEKAVDTFNAL